MPIPEIGRYGYSAARRDFIELAQAAGLSLRTFVHPQLQGPAGEALAIDVAMWRPERMSTLLVSISGTHGVEGLAGSVCQRALLKEDIQRICGAHTGVLLIHALNAYGFAYLTRTNEHNVDLNRNGLSSFHNLPRNDEYGRLHGLLVPKEWECASATLDVTLANAIAAMGVARFQQAVTAGQYHWPNGLFYGGTAAQWSRRVLESVVAIEFHDLSRIAVLDVHTGLGGYGEGELIYTGSAADPEYGVTKAFFAKDVVTCPDAGDSVSAAVSGALSHAFSRWAMPGALASAALEFGVRDVMTTLDSLRGDAWLRGLAQPPAETRVLVQRKMLDAFFSTDPVWLERVESRFMDVVLTSLEALR